MDESRKQFEEYVAKKIEITIRDDNRGKKW